MEALKSTALIPGEPEFKTEFNLLNRLLIKIPNDVDLRLILNAKPLQPRHSVALHELHSELFPIRYDPKFFEVACSTDCGLFDSQSFWDFFDKGPNDTRDLDWYENQIVAIGIFLPRTYVSFFRRTGEYDIEKYLHFLVRDGDYSEFDDPLTALPVYDDECDEFMIGFVTMLINLEETNNLISCDDYNILRSFYNYRLAPLIYNMEPGENNQAAASKDSAKLEANSNYVDANSDLDTTDNAYSYAKHSSSLKGSSDLTDNEVGDLNSNGYESFDSKCPHQNSFSSPANEVDVAEMEERIRSCVRLNESLLSDNFYLFLYNNLYNNDLLMEYIKNFNIKDAKSIYILSTGITLGLRKRKLGSHVILFVQLLIYYINYNIFSFDRSYYKLGFDVVSKEALNACCPARSSSKKTMAAIRNYYNGKFVGRSAMFIYYTYVLNLGHVPFNTANFVASVDVKDLARVSLNPADPQRKLTNGQPAKLYTRMPLVLYLHTIHYNEYATAMYEKLNFYNIRRIPEYYNINNRRFDANFLAHYLCL